jgi:hypothetical protein
MPNNYKPNRIYWGYRCQPNNFGDWDFKVHWDNTTVQCTNLRSVTLRLELYLKKDTQWRTVQQTLYPTTIPTSQPFNFTFFLHTSWCKINCDETAYLGTENKFKTLLQLLCGANGEPVADIDYWYNSDSEYSNLKFCSQDPFLNEQLYPECLDQLPDCLNP